MFFHRFGLVLGCLGRVWARLGPVLGFSLGPSGAVLSLSWGCLDFSRPWESSGCGFGNVLDHFGVRFEVQNGVILGAVFGVVFGTGFGALSGRVLEPF